MQHGPSVGMDGAPMDPHAYMRMLQAQQMMERMRQQNSRGAWEDTMQMTPFSVFGGQ
jgi:hypothetical protein